MWIPTDESGNIDIKKVIKEEHYSVSKNKESPVKSIYINEKSPLQIARSIERDKTNTNSLILSNKLRSSEEKPKESRKTKRKRSVDKITETESEEIWEKKQKIDSDENDTIEEDVVDNLDDMYICMDCSPHMILRGADGLVDHGESQEDHADIKPLWMFNQVNSFKH